MSRFSRFCPVRYALLCFWISPHYVVLHGYAGLLPLALGSLVLPFLHSATGCVKTEVTSRHLAGPVSCSRLALTGVFLISIASSSYFGFQLSSFIWSRLACNPLIVFEIPSLLLPLKPFNFNILYHFFPFSQLESWFPSVILIDSRLALEMAVSFWTKYLPGLCTCPFYCANSPLSCSALVSLASCPIVYVISVFGSRDLDRYSCVLHALVPHSPPFRYSFPPFLLPVVTDLYYKRFRCNITNLYSASAAKFYRRSRSFVCMLP